MAAPVPVSTTESTETTYATSHDIALPTVAAGNHLVCSSGFDGAGGTISTPAGWVEVLAVDLNANQKWRVWIRECDGTEGATVVVTTSAGNQSAHRVLKYTGVRAGVVEGTTWDVAELGATGYGTTIDPPPVTTTWASTDNSYIVLAWAGGNSPAVSDYPDGYSNTGDTTARVTIATGTKASTSTSDDPTTFTLSGSNNYRAATLVLRGAADIAAGAIAATGTGQAHNATTLPPQTRAQAEAATGTGEAHGATIKTAQVASDLVVEWDLDNDGRYGRWADTGVWRVIDGRIVRPDGREMLGAGLNGGVAIGTGASFTIDDDVSIGWAYDGYPGVSVSGSGKRYSDVWAESPQLVNGDECFPGGTISAARYWNHALIDDAAAPLGTFIVDLPGRDYALTGVLQADAIAFGIPEPSDHWHCPIFRVNCHIRNGPDAARNGPITWSSAPTLTAAGTVPEYVTRIRDLVDRGIVVCPEYHDRTAVIGQPDYTIPPALLADPMLPVGSLSDGYIKDSILFYDALVAEFTGAENLWMGLPNEFNQDGRTSDYDNVILTLCRRLWGSGWTGITVLPLPRWEGDLAALARGDLDDLVDQLEVYQQGPIVFGWHNYGDRYDALGVQSVGTWAEVDADIAACRNGVPGSGRKHAVWMSEYGQPVPPGTGLPHAADGVRITATDDDGPALGIRWPHLCCTWWSTADGVFDHSYALTYGAINKGDQTGPDPNSNGDPNGGTFPWWKIVSELAADEWLTPGGRAHWDLAHAVAALDDAGATVENITGYVLSGWLRRGRDYPSQITGRSRPGVMQLVLDNSDNRFSFYNTGSPLNTPPYSLKTGRRIRVRTAEASPDDPTVLARDRFATNGPLATDEVGNTWSAPAGFSGLSVLAKTASADGAPSGSGALYGETVDVGATTYYAQCVVPYKDATNRAGLLFHHTDASNYGAIYQGDGTLYLVEVVAGTPTILDSVGTENRDDMAIGVAVNGTQVIGYVDGVEQVSASTSLTPTTTVGLYGRWYYQRAPLFSEFWCWDRAIRTQTWDPTPSGVLATMRVTKTVPTTDNDGRKTITVTAAGDLGLLDRPIEAPASTGPDDIQSAGSKPGHLIGNALAKVGALHPPGPIDGGDLTLGSVGLDRQQAISIVRRMEATEAGFVYELPVGGIGFDRRSARDATTAVGAFTDDPAVTGYKIERFALRDWQGDVINDVTSEVSGRLARYDVVTSNNNFEGFGVANDATFNLPDAGDGAAVGDLFIVAISSTVWTAGVRWITPPGWTALRDPGDEKGKMAVFAKRATAADLGDAVTFYDDSTPAGGAWAALVFIVHNWLGSIASGVAVTEAVGYGPDQLTQAQAGTVDYPVVFTPWGARPTLFIALRSGAHTSSAAAVVSSASDDQAPNGFDSMGSVHINPSGFGQEVLHTAIQWARRIRTEAVLNPTSMGGTFSGFSYTEGLIVMVRGGFDGEVPTASGGLPVRDSHAADQEDRAAVLAHPDPGRHFEDETAARAYNDLVLARFGTDRPIVSLGFTATRDARHRDLAVSLDLSQRFRVDADGRIGEGIDAEFFVETITHSFSQGTRVWSVDLDLSPAVDAGAGAD